MPLLAGSVTCRRYRVTERPPDGYLQPFARAIVRHAFRPLDDAKDETETAGWVNPRNPLDTNLNPSEWHVAPYVLLGFRLDRKAIPARMLRARVELAVREMVRTGRREKLTREERAAVEMKTRHEMLRAMAPATRVVEVAWNVESGRLVVASTASSMNDLIVGSFTETFGVTPVPLYPAILAEEWAERHGRARDLGRAHPTDVYGAVRDRLRAMTGRGPAEVVDAIATGAGRHAAAVAGEER